MEIELSDKFEKMGAQMVREVASKTIVLAGDGTTTATVLAILRSPKLVAAGINPMDLKRGIDLAVAAVVKDIQAQAKKVKSSEGQAEHDGRADMAKQGKLSVTGHLLHLVRRQHESPRPDQTSGRYLTQVAERHVVSLSDAIGLPTWSRTIGRDAVASSGGRGFLRVRSASPPAARLCRGGQSWTWSASARNLVPVRSGSAREEWLG